MSEQPRIAAKGLLPTALASAHIATKVDVWIGCMTDDSEIPPPFDQRIAGGYVGKYILVGLTYLDHEGKETHRLQLHGVVEKAAPDGIAISLRGARHGESWNMPPDFRAISEAGPGIYTLHSTSERVENPDLLATWTIHAPPPKQ